MMTKNHDDKNNQDRYDTVYENVSNHENDNGREDDDHSKNQSVVVKVNWEGLSWLGRRGWL